MPHSIFEHDDYRTALRAHLRSLPRRGHGQLARIAAALGVHPTLLTQILRGNKSFSLDQALLVAEYLGFSETETEYFLQLVQLDRAAHHKLKARLRASLEKLRARQDLPQSRMTKHQVLTEADRALFYSNWFYSAIRLLAGIDGQGIEQLSAKLRLDRRTTQQVVEFLVGTGLLVQEKGRFRLGPQRTYLPADSILVSRHHANWRLKAIENLDHLSADELAFTGPISISRKDFGEAKKILLRALEEISALVEKSKEEVVGCVNLDLFLLTK